MTYRAKPGRDAGRVAIVEIAATATTPGITMIEVIAGAQSITISDHDHPLSDDIHELARQLIAQVRKQHG